MAALFPSLRGYRPAWLRGDVVAGFTVWAVLVPESLAYASIAGVDPVVGLYAAPAALVLYALLGSSRHLVVGPMSATAALSAAVVGGTAAAGSADFAKTTAALAVVTGVIALLAGLLRLGFLAGFISEPVLKGFIIGLALTIIAGQLPKLFGVPKGDGDFFEKIWDFATRLGRTDWRTAAVGLASLAVVLALGTLVPLLPASLIAVALGVLAVLVFDLERKGVAVVGNIKSGLPPLGLPGVGFTDCLALAGGAVGVALVGFAEGLGAAKTYAARSGYAIDADRELLGLGAANLGAGLCSGMPVNGSLSKTAVNGGAGARSQVSGLTVAVLTIVTLLFLTGLFEKLPEATLGAVVIAAVIELVDVPALVRLYRMWTRRLGRIYGPAARADFIAAIAALAGVLLFDTLPGLFIGIGVSLLLLLYRASRPNIAELGRIAGGDRLWVDVRRRPDAVTRPDVAVVRVESGLFFANADRVQKAMRVLAGRDGVRAVVLDAETVPFVDVTAAEMLADLRRDLERQGVAFYVAHDVGQVRDMLRRQSGEERHVYPSVDSAVQAAEAGSDS
ncbi:SulP family inorganic anion transporter [Actinomadura macrotermitis]|uniref:Putative sulfate transporter n=1 Tax=Actinomadura macrotermitis TaxID=2585200 RepID=A0A7K0BWK8_9ACTN|nr:SulP family inorganic anion transporter [Actinomadura macrotermitis]MQY05547.1 putative sulfate transporter [Actinomadura macrotermitis]